MDVAAKYSITVGPAVQAARQALKAGLYQVGGLLKETLRLIVRDNDPQCTVALLHQHPIIGRRKGDVRDVAVGVVVILTTGHTMAYLQPAHRRRGWGRRLVEAAIAASMVERERLFSRPGDDFLATAAFWKQVGVVCREFDNPLSLTRDERAAFVERRRTLVCRPVEKLPSMLFERLYLDGLYADEYGDEHNGLRGQLHALIGGEWVPISHLLFHFKVHAGIQDYISLATIEPAAADERQLTLQLFVRPDNRRQGLGQELIDRVRGEFPHHALLGYHTDTSRRLFERNGITDLTRTS